MAYEKKCRKWRCSSFLVLCLGITACNQKAPEPWEQQAAYYEPNPTKVISQNAKPKTLPLSRYGNLASYKVKGKSYQVLHDTSAFKQQGIASWYGPNFHKQRTSSGEVYDMYQMTAAHKTLPLPCFVKVKNTDNGREVIVKVNDRGPFHTGRIIDLSYSAATKLDMLANGTANVEIELLTTPKKEDRQVSWYIQTGAFSKAYLANNMAAKLKTVVDDDLVRVKQQKKTYLVNVGPLLSDDALLKAKNSLGKIGILDSFTFLSR